MKELFETIKFWVMLPINRRRIMRRFAPPECDGVMKNDRMVMRITDLFNEYWPKWPSNWR